MELSNYLKQVKSCKEAIEWAKQYDSLDLYEAIAKAWNECDNGEWLLWFAGKIWGDYTSEMRLAACDIAESVVHLAGKHEKVCRETIAVARMYANGEATDEELLVAAKLARAASSASSAARATVLSVESAALSVNLADLAARLAADSAGYSAHSPFLGHSARGGQQTKNAELTRKWITADMVVKQVKLKRKR